ncbi:serine/threonine-protein kinase [Cellulomonas sp. PSBB021]|uniref:serine/threonine-protein kinase n=1 Tax=Cellulomonas sp. PSBB021 TaxID=2003551 RepID=UPI000B8D4C8D|nr:serine/threonine-protein kinase [Cellulomonas sp. PSBB021]ASR55971.1 serine/threonine protein kinase [Cellulomonas sp. PSBB021]
MRTTAGQALGNRYRLVRQIAVGGMGEVWEGYDESLARPVAVKVLKEEFAGDQGFLERFRTEARNSAALSHANIAQLFDYGEQDGSSYLVMELVTGEPLSDLLEREPVLPVRRLLPILAQTARGLHAAHEAGVVHRDVKPGNILLGRGGRVKITDFGVSLARNQMTMTATGMVMGTAQYLSPEQAVGRPATPLSDLYSLGIIAYESLVGHRPFTGPTAVDIAVAHVNTPVPPLPKAVDPKLADLVVRLLSKDPAQRPTSGAALARELDRLLPRTPAGGVPVIVSRPTPRPLTPPRAPTPVGVPPGTPPPPGPATPGPATPGTATPGTATPGTAAPAGSGAQPPSYPPRRDLRPDSVPPRPPATGRGTLQGSGPRLGRFGRMSWPLLALVLLLGALLGAALAGQLTKADSAPSGAALARIVTWTSVAQAPPGGMIGPDVSPARVDQGPQTEVKDA